MFKKFFYFSLITSLLIINSAIVNAKSHILELQVPIGTSKITLCQGNQCSGIGNYINTIYKWSFSVVFTLGVVMMMIGGLIWTTARGDTAQVAKAQKFIGGAVTGIILLTLSHLLLSTINPNLVNFSPLQIKTIAEQKEQVKTKAATNKPPLASTQSPSSITGKTVRCCFDQGNDPNGKQDDTYQWYTMTENEYCDDPYTLIWVTDQTCLNNGTGPKP